ncbi:MAG: ABC transporter permease, partial [Mediterranea sp.]|nr:ABC transporter permease [Mediterranea sp.]
MFLHYLTLAFRNLWKYRTQSLISIVGLAVGFVCFALANLWIHYEVTYDKTIQDIGRTYLMYSKNHVATSARYSIWSSMLAAPTLVREYPEVEAAASYRISDTQVTANTTEKSGEVKLLFADSTFLSI